MKKEAQFFTLVTLIFFAGIISAAAVSNDLHLNIQTTNSSGSVVTGTFKFEFNISTLEDCSNVAYTNFTNLTTDSRGIISYYLKNVNLNFSEQYWLCYYRDATLINTTEIARAPYSFRAKNVSAEGVIADSNLNLGLFNILAYNLNTSLESVFIGTHSSSNNSAGDSVFVGYFAGENSSAINSVGIGWKAGRSSGNSIGLTAVGLDAGHFAKGFYMSGLGYDSIYNNIGSYVTAIGLQSCRDNTGNYVSCFGDNAGFGNIGNNSIFIGYEAGKDNILNDQFIIKQTHLNAIPLILGNFSSGFIGLGTSLTSFLTHELTVNGSTNTTKNSFVGGNQTISGSLTINGASRVTATQGVMQTIPDSVATTIKFETEEFDNLGEYNGTDFVPKEAGYYAISGVVSTESTAWTTAHTLRLFIYKNDVQDALVGFVRAPALTTKLSIGGIEKNIYLTPSDFASLKVIHNNAPEVNTSALTFENYITIYRTS